jgi:ABC-type multidrug transport system ATPase subunit
MSKGIKATVDHKYVIETHDLTYYYGKHLAVDHVNLKIKAGTIYSF